MFSTPEMTQLFSGRTFVKQMLAFESALARAEARAGLVPVDAAEAIAARCRVDLFDVSALFREAAASATPAVPLVRRLTALVEGEARRYVHWGATSQDVTDTAMMLQARDGLDLLAAGLLAAGDASAALAAGHRHTPMAGRTFLQHAVPISFGLKAARWLAAITRGVLRLRAVRGSAVALQFGGAAGTLAALGDLGETVAGHLAEELDLPRPGLPWHAERDRIVEIAAAAAIVAGSMAKVASDLALLSQTEVGEISISAAGRSSAMPHKRNPVHATEALAASRLATAAAATLLGGMAHEHERAVGALQTEWQALPDLFRYASGAVEWVAAALERLDVHPERMRANLDRTGGLLMAEALTMALAEKAGRPEAYRIVDEVVARAARDGIPLREAASADPRIQKLLPGDRLDRTLDPEAYRGSADSFIDRALRDFQEVRSTGAPAGGRTGGASHAEGTSAKRKRPGSTAAGGARSRGTPAGRPRSGRTRAR
jgi:3-carboxy-cis,cis-muconate cycloisomerase